MATDKPLPDDDIIDLSDLVEEGSAADGAAGDESVDMSFEQELDDLFGDAEPMPAKSAPAGAEDEDEDLLDLAGFEVVEDEETAQPAMAETAESDDDVMDLAGLGLDEDEETPTATDLPDLGFDEEPVAAPAAAATGDDTMDISELGFEDLEPSESGPATEAGDSLGDLDFSDLEEKPAVEAVSAAAEEDIDLASLDFETAETTLPGDAGLDAAADLAATLTDEEGGPSQDISDADLDALLAEPDQAAGEAAMADLLGELPDTTEETTPEQAAPAEEAHETTTAETVAVAAAAAVPLAAMAAAATARHDAGPSVGGIDLGALDTLIDSSKAPTAEAETPAAAPDTALLDRLDALESAAASLGQRLDALPPAPSEDALADALAARLETSLAQRLEGLLASQPAAQELDGLKVDLLDEFHASLDSHLDALRAELPAADELVSAKDMASALDEMRQSLGRLEALNQGRHLQFEEFTQSMETKIAELRQELPSPEDLVSSGHLAEALDGLRQTLADDLDTRLDARIDAIADAVADAARQAARDEVATLGQSLASRLDALENDHIDPNALFATLTDTLRAEMTSEMERAVPKAAAAVIREEIAALVRDLGE